MPYLSDNVLDQTIKLGEHYQYVLPALKDADSDTVSLDVGS